MPTPPSENRAVTLDDIAQRLGVHKATVYRALVGSGRMTPDLRERIRAMAASLGYDPDLNASARRLALGKTRRAPRSSAVALVMPSAFYRTSFFLRLFQGTMDELCAADHSLHCFTFAGQDPQVIATGIARGAVDGALLLSDPAGVGTLAELLRKHPNFGGRPLVSLMNPVAGVPTVTADYRRGGALLAGHLLDLGHRHLLHFFDGLDRRADPNDGTPGGDRVKGMREAYRDRGLDPARLLHGHAIDYTIKEPQRMPRAVAAGLARFPAVTALVAAHDPMALAMIAGMPALGRSVPDDISVIGFDDSEPAAVAEAARLTTVALPLEGIGADAARLLLRLADDGEAAAGITPHAVKLVERGSTARPR